MSIVAKSVSATGSPVAGFVIIGLMTAAGWVAVVRYALPAVRSQSGRSNRMARHERIRRIGSAMCWAILPLLFAISLLTPIFAGPIGGSQHSAGLWPASWADWAPFGTVGVGAILIVASFVVRTFDRHRMRVQGGDLGLPAPRLPWWPWAVVAAWAIGVFGVFIAGSIYFWITVYTSFEDRSAAMEPALQAATLDDSVQKLIRAGAESTVITARMEQVAGVHDEIASLKERALVLVVGYGVVLLVVLAAFAVAAVVLYRRQVRRRTRYNKRVTESVTRAASMTL